MVRELEIARKYVNFLRVEKNEDACREIENGNSRVANYIGKVKDLSAEDRYSLENNLRFSLQHKISSVGIDLSNLISLGIIVTIIGMKLFASDFSAKSAGVDPQIFDIVRASLPGLDLALSGTLLGAIGAFWLGYLFRILISAKEQLIATLIEAGVYHGRS
jgi:ABC-type phosphate/phosphonate transport system permease subunit